jgi:hypothetical protein
MLPMGLKTVPAYFIDENKFAIAKAKANNCKRNNINVQEQTVEIEKILLKSRGSFPDETKMATELSMTVAETGRRFIKNSRAAAQILSQCYDLNAKFDDTAEVAGLKTDQMKNRKKRELYAKSILRQESPVAFCDRIWEGPEEKTLERTFQNLRELRESLFLLNSMERIGNEKKLLEYLGAILRPQDGENRPAFTHLFPWDKVWLIRNPLYQNAPQKLEPLTAVEQGELEGLIMKVGTRYPDVKLKEALLSNINRLVSIDPIIIQFENSKPNSSEIAKAMSKYAREFMDDSFENNLSDFQFFQYPMLVNEVIEDMTPEKRGDACAIAEFINRRSKAIAERGLDSVISLGAALSLGAGLGAATALNLGTVTGRTALIARTAAVLNAGGLPAMGAMVSLAIQRGISIHDEKMMCDTQAQDSKGLCRPENIVRNMIELQIQGILLATTPILGKVLKKLETRSTEANPP